MREPNTPHLTGAAGAVRLAIRVVPRANRNALDGVTETGAANTALIAFLADTLGVPKRGITLVDGERGREKMVEIAAPLAVIQERLRAATDHTRHG